MRARTEDKSCEDEEKCETVVHCKTNIEALNHKAGQTSSLKMHPEPPHDRTHCLRKE